MVEISMYGSGEGLGKGTTRAYSTHALVELSTCDAGEARSHPTPPKAALGGSVRPSGVAKTIVFAKLEKFRVFRSLGFAKTLCKRGR